MKWYGQIGFQDTVETETDRYEPVITERTYMGDLNKSYKSNQMESKVNQDITLGNELSIIFDPYLQENFYKIAYVTFGGAKWKISNASIQPPRIVLSFGSLYAEEQEHEE